MYCLCTNIDHLDNNLIEESLREVRIYANKPSLVLVIFQWSPDSKHNQGN